MYWLADWQVARSRHLAPQWRDPAQQGAHARHRAAAAHRRIRRRQPRRRDLSPGVNVLKPYSFAFVFTC
eukprot:scaffold15268_cov31-Phaeocystis_antarctica.AAC.1